MTDTDTHLNTERLASLIARYLEGAFLDICSEGCPRVTESSVVSADTVALTIEHHPPLDEWTAEKRVEHRELRLSPVQLPEQPEADEQPEVDEAESAEDEAEKVPA